MHRPRRLALLLSTALTAPIAGYAQPRIEVDATRVLGTVSRDMYGTNLEPTSVNNPEVAAFASQFTAVRFPGGDADSTFRWDMPARGPCNQWWTWPDLATTLSRAGSGLFLESNLLRSTPANVVAWMDDARTRGVRVAVVAVGNEVWGDFDSGYRTAAMYAADVRAHATAIHARYPDAKVIAAFGTFNEDVWNREVIRRTADVIDGIDLHWYPNHREYDRCIPSEVMAEPEAIPQVFERIRGIFRDVAPTRADRLEIVMGEYDCAEDPPPEPASRVDGRAYSQWGMPNAVCYGAAIGEMIYGGVREAHMYAVQGYRFGALPGRACEAYDTRVVRPKALAHQLWREHFGTRYVAVTPTDIPTYHSDAPIYWDGFAGDAPFIRAYAALTDDGFGLRLIVVSRQETAPTSVRFTLRGFDPAPMANAWELVGTTVRATNENVGGSPTAVQINTRAVTVAGSDFTLTIPPHSVTAYAFRSRTAPPETDAGTPRDVPVAPTDTPVVPTDTPVVRTDIPVVPTDTPVPPVDVPSMPDDIASGTDVGVSPTDTDGLDSGLPPAMVVRRVRDTPLFAVGGCAVTPARSPRGAWALVGAAALSAVRRRRTAARRRARRPAR